MRSKVFLVIALLSLSVIAYVVLTDQISDTKRVTSENADLYFTNTEKVPVEIYNTERPDQILFTGLGYVKVLLTATSSVSGAAYSSKEYGISILNNDDKLNVYLDSDLVFHGSLGTSGLTLDEAASPDMTTLEAYVTQNTWQWMQEPTNENIFDSYTVKHNKDHTVTITTDCNTFSGTYTLIGERGISYAVEASTLRECASTSAEALFLDIFNQANEIKITDDMKLLLSRDDRPLARFKVQLIPLL